MVLTFGTVILFFLGLMYAWSVFAEPLETEFGWTRNQTSMTYTISTICFQLGLLSNGILIKRISGRAAAYTGLIMLAFGLCMCVLTSSPVWIFVFYGVFCGLGIGICHNAWVTRILRWFPDKSGTASGIALFGYGMGGLLLGNAASALIRSPVGWRGAFLVLGLSVLIFGLVSMRFFLPAPSELSQSKISASQSPRRSVSALEMLGSGCFWLFFVWKGLLLSLGLAVIGQTAMIATDIGASAAFSAVIVGMLSIGNGLGRIFTGRVSDRIGVVRALRVTAAIFTTASVILLAGYSAQRIWLLVTSLVILGVCYGGTVLMSSSYINYVFGRGDFPMNNGVSALLATPFVLLNSQGISIVKVLTGSYLLFFVMMILLGIVATVVTLILPKFIKRMDKRLGNVK